MNKSFYDAGCLKRGWMDWRNGVRNICRMKEEGYIEVLRYPWGAGVEF